MSNPVGDPAPHPPSVDGLARSLADTGLPHPLLVDAARRAIAAGRPDQARDEADAQARRLLQPVVNATGVLLHTNLGRAPLAHHQTATATNLELDLATGRRGSRSAHVAALLARACDAEAALVVNNGAAAVLLVLAALARDRGVAVSRGELVEIGGGFRVPEVLRESGAHLVEVGTTNRTRAADYERALADPAADVAVLLHVHRSNYRITGFTESVAVAGLAAVGGASEPPTPVVADLGSGLLDAACPWLPGGPPAWLRDEPAARQTLAAGADLVTFSGDKLLGGVQAGIIAGRADLVQRCARHPLARALRPGGLVLASLQDTVLAYLRRDLAALPFWVQAGRSTDELRRRADAILADAAAAVGTDPSVLADPPASTARATTALATTSPSTAPGPNGTAANPAGSTAVAAATAAPAATEVPAALPWRVVTCPSVPGGGTLPGVEIESVGLARPGDHLDALRAATPPIIGRVHDGETILDLRTVDPAADHHVAATLAHLP